MPWLRTRPPLPFEMRSPTPPHGLQLVPTAGSLSCISLSHTQMTCNLDLGAARSGTCPPSLGAHSALVPPCHLGHMLPVHVTSPPHQPLTSFRHQLQAMFNTLRHFYHCKGVNPNCSEPQKRPHHADPALNTPPLTSWGPREGGLPLSRADSRAAGQ